MKLKEFARRTCEGSSIHGLAYLTKNELHWGERVFWALTIVLATGCSISICWNQWVRYKESPIVYTLELSRYGSNFPYNGITICTNYENQDFFTQLIASQWQCNPDCADFEYFWTFLRVVNLLRYDRLHTLTPYARDARLKAFNFLDALKTLHAPTLNRKLGTVVDIEEDMVYAARVSTDLLYAPSLQEAGLCRSTSRMTRYTNPFVFNKRLPVEGIMNCSHTPCDIKITPSFANITDLRVYSHSVDDIASPNHVHTIESKMEESTLLKIYLSIERTTAEHAVRDLPISYRKCRYKDENNLKYFDTYIIGLCIMECRIDSALKLCNCKPFFYMAAPHAPTCNIDGLVCLAAKNWAETNCSCMPLCEDVRYVQWQSGDFQGGAFSDTIYYSLSIPHLAVQRRVVFSSDQLLVSFGGAISLFLGMSFISVYGLIYYLIDFIGTNVLHCWRQRKYRERKTRRHQRSINQQHARVAF